MACEFINGDGVVFCVWGTPTKNDMDQILQNLRTSAAKVSGPAVYVARVPSDAPAPDARARAHLNALMPEIAPLFQSCHIVLEGDGFMAAMKRGVLVSLFQIGKRRSIYYVHSNVNDILPKISPDRLPAARSVLRRAQSSGLLSCPPPVSRVPRSA